MPAICQSYQSSNMGLATFMDSKSRPPASEGSWWCHLQAHDDRVGCRMEWQYVSLYGPAVAVGEWSVCVACA